ncbi:acyl-CoA dehydrogenase family protein [Zafaria sp. Z1313]|uniref:acyl-CoA dehydrogenase family protein n=1 Tax=unclassified Zafaria TaxID=2828765 RepID=UPI002E77D2D7|nr:acyl-CoA dehydrogenase family protein [Zafaria sp. J156]MEE1620341.1 acyl-CoA dehydrogenase family protein [Zafaria sp. J156]
MFQLDDEQQAILEMVRDFARERIAPHAAAWDRGHHFPIDVLEAAGGLGMGAIYVPEEHGGAGLGRLDAVRVFEELSKACPTIAAYISIHNMVVWMIDAFGDDAQREDWLPRLAGMGELASYCLTEPGAGSDAGSLTTRARPTGDGGYEITGTKQFISGAGAASCYLVMARTADTGSHGISAFLVDGASEGLSFGPPERKMGWNAQPTRQVVLNGVRVAARDRLGSEGQGFPIAMKGLNGGRLNIGACSLGGGQAALDAAIAHVRDREAFGRPLIEQQSVLFRLADLETQLEAARTLLWRAAGALDDGDPDAVRWCAMAKRVATDAGFDVANGALQLLGGYGYLAEYGIEKIVRDLRVHQILEGSNEIMRLIVGRMIAERRH